MTPDIIVPDNPLPEYREAIFRLLDAYNDARTDFPDPVAPLALLLREPGSDTIIGGLWASAIGAGCSWTNCSYPRRSAARGWGRRY
jgi:hypothetical protein